ncbi:zinc finger protein SNAI3 [Tamandua tetradactyla]|uniref:zinc finger protein SNAI3 n=1 Tax=Tamandua tetradactyla TaxID=48850 RepID=UPI0040541793
MPRSFLVKTHSSHRVPNYGQLETQRGVDLSCSTCERLARPQDVPAIACISLPGPHGEDGLGAPGPDAPEPSPAPRPCQLPGAPFKDDLNHPNLSPSRAPVGEPGDHEAPDPQQGREDVTPPPGGFPCLDCHLTARPPPVPRAFPCKLCAKAPASLGALKLHLRTHTLPCVCAVCGKAFSRPWLLQGHVRTHTGEKPYACPLCSRAFADRSNLRAHVQTHSDAKRYPCTRCTKAFSRGSLLARHEEAGGCAAPERRRPAP